MKQSKIIIGLIGGSGVGKGVFSAAAKALGFTIIDGDKIGHEVLQKEAYNDLVKEFGNGILYSDGSISRKMLGGLVFNDSKALQRLNEIVHGHITKRIRSQMTDKCVIDAAVLHKTELINECTHVIAVTAEPDVRIERIMRRDNIEKEAAVRRISSQLTNEEYAVISDIVLQNNGSEQEFFETVKECLQSL